MMNAQQMAKYLRETIRIVQDDGRSMVVLTVGTMSDIAHLLEHGTAADPSRQDLRSRTNVITPQIRAQLEDDEYHTENRPRP